MPSASFGNSSLNDAENSAAQPAFAPQAPAYGADSAFKDVAKPEIGDIHISADKLVSSRDKDSVEFFGNVVARQGDAVIRSERLRIYYNNDDSAGAAKKKASFRARGEKNSPAVTGANPISEIVAEGNVKMEMKDRRAFCDRAVYHVARGIVVLSGKDVRISQGDNFIHGRKIILDQKTGDIRVSGGPEKRVEAVFNPAEKKTRGLLGPGKAE